ncbi:unnamed protein product [Blepharisma stoltei]|uniref:IPT/TIG domain-containing protein n=1 Tax=Blepharisma stoltei TaxID=1481888 RepID=A0AAU9JHA6_9CILI|nr:unnamed protein product [Blepharisma stoltei]
MAKVGEVMICGMETNGNLASLEGYNGRTVDCIGGGFNKLYIVEAAGQVTALQSDTTEPPDESEIEVLEKLGLKNIKCGMFHSVFLTKNGFVFTCGNGVFGVLGHGGAFATKTPQIVKALSDKVVMDIACGEAHTLALTEGGDIYAWGRGFEGQLGIRNSIEAVSVPKYVDAFYGKTMVKVACGQRHSLAIDSEGVLYAWGEARCGQLGNGTHRQIKRPQVVSFPEGVKVKEVSAGSGHTAALSTEGCIYLWGYNHYGQLGLGDQNPRWFPEIVKTDYSGLPLLKIEKIKCAVNATFCIDIEGKAYSWGKGMIGHGNILIQSSPKKIDMNTDYRQYSQVYACDHTVLFFSPLRIFSISPICGPASGGTKLALIGTAFSQTEKLKVRFRYGHLQIESECKLDPATSSLELITPKFIDDGEEIQLPIESYIDVTMDGEHYVTCEKKFLIYSNNLISHAINPKCASVSGGTLLEINIDLDMMDKSWLFHLTVGFLPKPKGYHMNKSINTDVTPSMIRRESHDESRISISSGKMEDADWQMTSGRYIDGKVLCKVPTLFEYDENSMGYVVDVAINGQQFTGKPINFRYYDIEIFEMVPNSGYSNEGTTVRILGRGLYDSSAKKVRISTEYGEREVSVNWERKTKSYLCVIPPLSWLFGGEEPDPAVLRSVKSKPIKLELTLNGIEYTALPPFYYIDVKILRASKVKFDENLPIPVKTELWEREEPEEHEDPEIKAKREQEENIAMQLPCKPNTRLFLWCDGLIKTPTMIAQFVLNNSAIQVPGIYKNSKRLAVIVPDLGDIPTPADVSIALSLNGQTFSKETVNIKYVGLSAHDEPPKRKR